MSALALLFDLATMAPFDSFYMDWRGSDSRAFIGHLSQCIAAAPLFQTPLRSGPEPLGESGGELSGDRTFGSKRRRIGAGLALALVLLVSGCAGGEEGGTSDNRPQRAADGKGAGQNQAAGQNAGQGGGGRNGGAVQANGGGTSQTNDAGAQGEPTVADLLSRLKVSAEVEEGL